MPEWLGQSGLWLRDQQDGSYDAIGVEDAGFSEALGDRIEDWMDEFDSIFRDDDPSASCFPDAERFSAWRREGEAIATAVLVELRPGDSLDVVLPSDLGPK
ncbi:MAG TPA: hypothetical protein PKW21_15640 [Rhabdaerophilum sp.]|nr:hypothetical protein [Rhabdaerophilum sp.]